MYTKKTINRVLFRVV